ncbi:hypothetical protein BDZ90DRAFT_188715 [Jaminaea rosea]|uniref:Uncharacterized protein n=1 Tax=Jaminaea rosea TaxID=1569628 RepID=A0A316UTK1_9BASI|nr:hypothetical protein BDZ90DRAFT_188715 [Jaminaea rosea]PWN27233.1 hypothetical protein BDZ90DRAFT_188715 [Jaminaea rosea]
MRLSTLSIFVAFAISAAAAMPTQLDERGGKNHKKHPAQHHPAKGGDGHPKHPLKKPHPKPKSKPHPHPAKGKKDKGTTKHPHPHPKPKKDKPSPHPHPHPHPHPLPHPKPHPSSPTPGDNPPRGDDPADTPPKDDGGDTTTPPGDGGDNTTPPGEGDGNTTPPGDDGDTTPPGDDGDTTPPGDDPIESPSPPTRGVLSYNADEGVYLLGDNLSNDPEPDNSELGLVAYPQTWSLSQEGFLVAPSGRYVYAQTPDYAYYVQLAKPNSPVLDQFPAAPYKCTVNSEASNEQAAVLDCTATTTAGSFDSFTICYDHRIEGDAIGCGGDDEVIRSFKQFTLTAD